MKLKEDKRIGELLKQDYITELFEDWDKALEKLINNYQALNLKGIFNKDKTVLYLVIEKYNLHYVILKQSLYVRRINRWNYQPRLIEKDKRYITLMGDSVMSHWIIQNTPKQCWKEPQELISWIVLNLFDGLK